jgi:hypothetical protein
MLRSSVDCDYRTVSELATGTVDKSLAG